MRVERETVRPLLTSRRQNVFISSSVLNSRFDYAGQPGIDAFDSDGLQ